jgi:hypothetical protein
MRFSRLHNLPKMAFNRALSNFFELRQKFLLMFLSGVLGLVIGLLLIVERRQWLSSVHQMEKQGFTIATHLGINIVG